MPKISVIVPVYNTEKYLEQCIQSILDQTYTDFELLLIDDGSTDRSGIICDNYAEQFSCIRAFHKLNGGLSSARNVGINNTKGEYVIFVDSDDFWTNNTILQELVNVADLTQCDIVRGEAQFVGETGDFLWDNLSHKKNNFANVVMSGSQFMRNIICGKWWCWLSLYKSNIMQNFNEDLRFQEDIEFHIRIFLKSLRCVYIPLVFYAYRQRSDSLVHNIKLENLNFSFNLSKTFDIYSNKCKDEQTSHIYQYYSIMMYYWSLCTLCDFFYTQKMYIIKEFKLLEIQTKAVYLARYNIFKYPIVIFVEPHLGCIILKNYIRLKRVARFLFNKILGR